MDKIKTYYTSQFLKMANLIKKCGGVTFAEELEQNAQSFMKSGNIKTASRNGFSKTAMNEMKIIEKNALSEASRLFNDLANDYSVIYKDENKTILANYNGNKVSYNTPLLKVAGLMDTVKEVGSLAGSGIQGTKNFLGGMERGDVATGLMGGATAEGGGMIGAMGKGFAVAQFSELLDRFAQEVKGGDLSELMASAKDFLKKNWLKLASILAGVALYTWRTQKQKQNEQAAKQTDELATQRQQKQQLPEAAAKSRRVVKTAAKQNVKNMCEMANYLDEIGDYRNAALLDSTARTIMKYVD